MPTTVYNKTETDDLLELKVDKVAGKQLSSEDFTTDEKTKLAGIEAGAEVNVNADWNATSGDAQILNKPSIPSKTSDLTNDSDFITASAVASEYVAKDGSKVLSDNNYDSASKSKLDNLVNITAIGDNLTLSNGTLSAGASNPPGCVLQYAGAGTIPSGYLLCDGTSVSRTTYANLFAAIGTTYGAGDGSTTFKLPDFRGAFLRGYDGTRSAAIGTEQADGLPEISGTLHAMFSGTGTNITSNTYNTGAFSPTNSTTSGSHVSSTLTLTAGRYLPTFNASSSNSIYGASPYVTPYNYAIQFIIKY